MNIQKKAFKKVYIYILPSSYMDEDAQLFMKYSIKNRPHLYTLYLEFIVSGHTFNKSASGNIDVAYNANIPEICYALFIFASCKRYRCILIITGNQIPNITVVTGTQMVDNKNILILNVNETKSITVKGEDDGSTLNYSVLGNSGATLGIELEDKSRNITLKVTDTSAKSLRLVLKRCQRTVLMSAELCVLIGKHYIVRLISSISIIDWLANFDYLYFVAFRYWVKYV